MALRSLSIDLSQSCFVLSSSLLLSLSASPLLVTLLVKTLVVVKSQSTVSNQVKAGFLEVPIENGIEGSYINSKNYLSPPHSPPLVAKKNTPIVAIRRLMLRAGWP